MSTRNRLANAKNEYQGKSKKVLCVCSAGLLRSPTLAWVLSQPPYNYNTRAAGISKEYALIPVDDVLIHWADTIISVEPYVETQLLESFNTEQKELICLDVPDMYGYRDQELVSIIREQCEYALRDT